MNFTVTQTIKPEQISSLICSAFEGGSNYWCKITKKIKPTTWEFDSDPGTHWLHDYALNPGGALFITDVDNEHKAVRFDTTAIEKGLAILAKDHPKHFADILADDADAETGDVFLQCCVFGEIVYQ